jgi:hypothetical protein
MTRVAETDAHQSPAEEPATMLCLTKANMISRLAQFGEVNHDIAGSRTSFRRSREMSSIPKYSRAAVLREFKAPLQIEEVAIPSEIEPEAILTRIETCSICGADVHLSPGALALKVDLPVIVAHEIVGRTVVFGPGSRRDSIGQDLREVIPDIANIQRNRRKL